MKPRYIKSLADLEATINWRAEQFAACKYETFVICMQIGVGTGAMMKLFHTKNAKVIENWKSKYNQFMLP